MKKLLLSIFILSSFISFAQVDRSKAPEGDTPKNMDFGKVIPIKLDNGLSVYLVQRPGYPNYTISVNINFQDRDDQEREEYGNVISDYYYSDFKSKNYSKKQIDKICMQLGTQKGITNAGGFMRGMKRDLYKTLPMYADAIVNPVFSKKNIKETHKKYNEYKEKQAKRKITNKNLLEFNATKLTDSLLYGVSPKEDLEKSRKDDLNYNDVTVADIVKYNKDYRSPNNANLLIYGDFSVKEATALAKKYFGNWKKGINIPVKNARNAFKGTLKNRKVFVVNKPDASQDRIQVNWALKDAYAYDKNHLEIEVLNEIFGSSQMSYLYRNIREDKGLTYFIKSSLSGSQDGGRGAVWSSVTQGKADLAVENIFLEMMRIRNTEVSDQDLYIAKNSLIGSFSRGITGVATTPFLSFIMIKDTYKLSDNYLAEKLRRLHAINKDNIKALANKYINPYECIVIVTGKVEHIKGKLEKFGEVTYFDKDGTIMKFDK